MLDESAPVDARILAIRTIIHDSIAERDHLSIDVSHINATTSMRSLPVDSMTVIELIDQLNSTFSCRLSPEDVYGSATVGDLLGLIPS